MDKEKEAFMAGCKWEREMGRPDWQPIETAPKDTTQFLAYSCGRAGPPDHYYGVACWAEADEDLGFVQGWFWSFAIRPTHWMPLPAPPAPAP